MNLKEIFATKLRETVQACQFRGLFKASQWAAEQLSGLEPDNGGKSVPGSGKEVSVFSSELEKVNSLELGAIMLSFSLLPQGQFLRAAFNIQKLGEERSKLSNLALFIYAYSQYMAGEKQKSQQKQNGSKSEQEPKPNSKNRSSSANEKAVPTNSLLPELYEELLPFYTANRMDSYLLYIFAVVTRELYRTHGRNAREVLTAAMSTSAPTATTTTTPTSSPDPFYIFQQSLVRNPWNWSAWLDFSAYCIHQRCKIPSWDEMMSNSAARGSTVDTIDKQCGRAVYAFFMAHCHVEQHRGDLAITALEKLQKIFPSSVFLSTQIGVVYYAQRMYEQAEEHFVSVRTKDPYRLQHMDTYSNILYVHEKSPELALLAHHVVQVDKFAPEVCCVVGNHYSLRGQHQKAVVYFQRALRSQPHSLSAWTLLGHEYMELHNTVAAIQCYRHGALLVQNPQNIADIYHRERIASSSSPATQGDFRAWYGLGQTYEMIHCHQYALYYFHQAATMRPDDARMWSAVGNAQLRLNLRREAMASYERAVYTCHEREGVATRDLARLYKEEARLSSHGARRQGHSRSQGQHSSLVTMYTEKAAETYYRFLLTSNVNNQYNLFPVVQGAAATGTANGGEEEEESFPPATLDELLLIIREPQHMHHHLVHGGDDVVTGQLSGDHHHDHEGGVVTAVVDAVQAEALLFLAGYAHALKDVVAAQYFCSRLLSFTGPEGDQARIMLRELRAEPESFLILPGVQQQQQQLSQHHHLLHGELSQLDEPSALGVTMGHSRMSLGGELNLEDEDESMVVSSPVSQFSSSRRGGASAAGSARRQSALFHPDHIGGSDHNNR